MLRPPSPAPLLALLLATASLSSGACQGDILPGETTRSIAQGVSSAIPRLSRREIEASIVDTFGLAGVASQILPEESRLVLNPSTNGEEEVFDTFTGAMGEYLPSEVFVQAMATVAHEVARRVSEDPALVETLAGCAPSGADDEACMRALIERVGLRLFRRPLTADESERLLATAMGFSAAVDFPTGVRVVVASLLQSPDFIYRPEVGAPHEGDLRRLDNHELISRLSFFFWGAPPTPELLERASGPLFDDDGVILLAEEMAADPRTDAQIRTFHEMWLRYQQLLVTDPSLAADMLVETETLLSSVLSDAGRPWSELFTSTETYVTPALAAHYGMASVPAAPGGWVGYENDERSGILAHGSFLSLSSTRGAHTLPSRRGAMIAQRVLCIPILPPPIGVDIDDGVEVPPGACKFEAYEAHRDASSSCRGCHELMDGIGFGFERFDGLGGYREVEADNPACTIDGAGEFEGTYFNGPRSFVDAASSSGDLLRCGTEQFLRFSLRRPLDTDDFALAGRLERAFVTGGEDFHSMMVDLATDAAFRYRREAP